MKLFHEYIKGQFKFLIILIPHHGYSYFCVMLRASPGTVRKWKMEEIKSALIHTRKKVKTGRNGNRKNKEYLNT